MADRGDLVFDKAEALTKLTAGINGSTLIGSLSTAPIQNHIHGLPLLSMPAGENPLVAEILSRPLLLDRSDNLNNEKDSGSSGDLMPCYTSAMKYGSHYSVYPWSPFRYHSCMLLHELDSQKDNGGMISMQDIICFGRLSNTVKKIVVLVPKEQSSSGSDDDVISICWTGW